MDLFVQDLILIVSLTLAQDFTPGGGHSTLFFCVVVMCGLVLLNLEACERINCCESRGL